MPHRPIPLEPEVLPLAVREWQQLIFQEAAQVQRGADWEALDLNRLMPFIKGEQLMGKRGEDLFHLILSGIREIYEVPAIIAGGAVRDLAAGITDVKDVDVFIPITLDKFHEGQDELGWQGPFKMVKTTAYERSDKCAFKVTARIASRVQNVLVDLVFVEKHLTKDMVASFPIYTQRVAWSLEGGQMLSPEAINDLDNKQFTIDPKITDKERLKGLLTKVKEWQKRPGYKDWKIIEPNIKEWWEVKDEETKKEEQPQAPRKILYNDFLKQMKVEWA